MSSWPRAWAGCCCTAASLIRLERNLRPDPSEVAAAEEGDVDEHRLREGVRFAAAMADVLAIIECAAKATHMLWLGEAPARVHGIGDLLRRPGRARCGPEPASSEATFADRRRRLTDAASVMDCWSPRCPRLTTPDESIGQSGTAIGYRE
ncbi:MAG: hypothetical protein F4Y76_11885 [Acidimicrobiales bacterium]|nr:hypothetical protein [Acidimicrobiales bacterium]MYG60372.1 hypothetical protein [Acidimicrobiales bacterium]